MAYTPLLTKRGKEKLAKDGYMYNFEKLTQDGTKKMWRCDQRNVQKCPARLHTDLTGQTVVAMKHSHSHGSDPALVEVAKIKVEMKRRAAETLETPEEILNNALANTGLAVKGQMPNIDAARKMVQRARNSVVSTPPVPRSLQDLDVPEDYQRYELEPGKWEPFLLADAACEDNLRILIFGRQSCSTWIYDTQELFIDGTFKVNLPIFSHVYVVSVKRGTFVMPVLYALLPNTERATHDTLLETIKLIWPQFHPMSVSVDFDVEIIVSMQMAFPDSRLFGCLFHLAQNCLRHLAREGLLEKYENDVEFSFAVRMIIALAFLPCSDLDESFNLLSNYLVHKMPDIQPVLNWFEDNFLGRPIFREGRRAAIFNQVTWLLHQRIVDGQDETFDAAGDTHRRLQSQLGMKQLNIWKLISALKAIQRDEDQLYEQYVNDEPPRKKRSKHMRANAQIVSLIETYDSKDRIEFITGIAQNILI